MWITIAPFVTVRDYCMICITFLHGLRVSELLNLKVSDYDPHTRQIHIRRLKKGLSTTQPLLPEEDRMLHCWLEERTHIVRRAPDEEWLFLSRHGRRLSRQRFWQLLQKYGRDAKLSVRPHPHMLRHACGFNLAERGNDTRLIQDYPGHRNIRHTVHYTASNAGRFRGVWFRNDSLSPLCGTEEHCV
ncbi:tyrosine-type recombinase/integrase [Escherichia coli]|uniref:tyrosine-type recombinase/integrase n=1 Tax=Escherichia coli TaxID=562 RepID=UPI0039DFABA0